MQSLADVIHFLADANLTQQTDQSRLQFNDVSSAAELTRDEWNGRMGAFPR